MVKTRREFTPEFKREAVALLESSGRPQMQVAAELGIQPSMLRQWRATLNGASPGPRSAGSTGASPPSPVASPSDQAAEITRLRRELDRTRMERDVLEKSHRHLRGDAQVTFAFIKQHARTWPMRLMRRHGMRALAGRRFRPCTTESRHDLPIEPNLLKQDFSAARPDTVWLADLTSLPIGEGWLYLAAVLDLAMGKIVGWSMRDHMRAELSVAALMMAAQRQRPAVGLICHSDRGSQDAAEASRDSSPVWGRSRR